MASHAHSTRTPLLRQTIGSAGLLSGGRIVASGGPVTRALAVMAAADPDHARIRVLRRSIAERIEADIALLDALAGDADFEENGDREPSLCGATDLNLHGLLPGEGGDDREGDAGDESEEENEHGTDEDRGEPSLGGITVDARFADAGLDYDGEISLGSLGGTATGCEGSQIRCSDGDRTEREQDTGSRTHRKPRESSFTPSPQMRSVRDEVRRLAHAKDRGGYAMGNARPVGIR